MDRATVLYDPDCGLCRWSAERLRRWDRGGRLRFAPLGGAEADELLHELPVAERWASWHLVDAHGRVRSGGRAVAPVLRLLPGGAPLAAAASRFPRATDHAYRWVAEHRDHLGRVLGQRACAVDPSAPRG
ncbi:MAG TPA: DCC1-like thiol-disulfide oxidoreductase family protein [Actinomycetota bacterium]|nr:DCC1-like thiol-disulfide oxidoreductase family protein [Actinomycetota bacterium]